MATFSPGAVPPPAVATVRIQALGLCPTASRPLLGTVFERLALWGLNLPASRNYYDQEWGCQAAAYSAAKFAVAAACSSVFAARDAEERARTQPLYVAAAGVAAISSIMAMTTESVVVKRCRDGARWVPGDSTLDAHLAGAEYEFSWEARAVGMQPSGRLACWLACHHFGDLLLPPLQSFPHVLSHLIESFMPASQKSAADSALTLIVRAAILRALEGFHVAYRARHLAEHDPVTLHDSLAEIANGPPGAVAPEPLLVSNSARPSAVLNAASPSVMVELPLTAPTPASRRVSVPLNPAQSSEAHLENVPSAEKNPAFFQAAQPWFRQWLESVRDALRNDPAAANRYRLDAAGTVTFPRNFLGRFAIPDAQAVSALSELGLVLSRDSKSVTCAQSLAVWMGLAP